MTTVGIATMAGREGPLRRVLTDLSPQADRIYVWSNDPAGAPSWCTDYDGVVVAPVDEDRTDAGKFYPLSLNLGGYFLACDDDMIYPPDYVQRITSDIDRLGGKRVVGYGGGRLQSPPIQSYYRGGRTQKLRWDEDVEHDWPCNIMLTCVCGWRSDLLPGFDHTSCTVPMMGDIWLALAAQTHGVGMTVVPHRLDWIRYQHIQTWTIYDVLSNGKDAAQTEVINDYAKPFRIL